MTQQTVKLLDSSGRVLAIARVADEGTHFGGSINLERTPAELRSLFDEFEEIVNDQMLSFLDALEEKIQSWRIRALFEDGSETPVCNLQVFPTSEEVSFKVPATVTPRIFPQAETPAAGYD